MKQAHFPENFLWGAASAAAQIEGGYLDGGRTPSIWDVAPAKKIRHGEDCRTACDHYHHYKEDVALMKQMGLKSYRFSVSWPRVIPQKGVVNEAGLQFYKDLVAELKGAGIEPIVTLYHWDMPVWVDREGGWKSAKICDYFADFVAVVVQALSDQVQWWLTMNEPTCFIMNGYMQGVHAPFKRNYLALNRLARNCMVAHGRAVQTIRKHAKLTPKVGIAMAFGAYVPAEETDAAIEHARRKTFEEGTALLSNTFWLDPIFAGKPVTAYGIYRTSKKDMDIIHQPLDFMAFNCYAPQNTAEWDNNGSMNTPGLPRNSMGWVVDGRALYWALRFLHERYGVPTLITENGMAENDFVSLDGKVHDPTRIDFIYRYLQYVDRALAEGIPLLGSQYWSVMDNFEWAEGYDPRFGLIFVDYNTQQRILKDSSLAYAEIIKTNGACLFED